MAIIEVNNLSKKYRLGEKVGHDTLRDTIAHRFSYIFRRNSGPQTGRKDETIWALRDVSFKMKEGEVVGFIGKNGAGKSTLFKILSRITDPTRGEARIRGRVGSLLEVGTGFHPELTGRENIFLNGAILGMRKDEIRKKFDEIVAFSDIEKFLDTPVKRYSSGMYVRLAFAVAAHMEPEILIVDEVLAVGDIQFQKRCLGKMGDVAQEGRTVLFVSHNLGAIKQLCPRSILLSEGALFLDGKSEEVIDVYQDMISKKVRIPIAERKDRTGDQRYKVEDIWFTDGSGRTLANFTTGQEVNIHVKIKAQTKDALKGVCNVGFWNKIDEKIFGLTTLLEKERISFNGDMVVSFQIKRFPLTEDNYSIAIFIAEGVPENYVLLDWIRDALELTVLKGDYHGFGQLLSKDHFGVFTTDYSVQIKRA